MQIDPVIWAGIITGVATLVTGWFAIGVFKMQKRNEKTNASISILFEVRNAEGKIDIISQKLHRNDFADLPSVLPTNNWRNYAHLFATNFDEDEFNLINTFYTSCEIIEDLVKRQNNFIWLAAEERSRVAQKLLGDIQVKFQEKLVAGTLPADAQKEFNNVRQGITQFYTGDDFFYAPQKVIDGLRFQITHLQKITTTTCGAKLKKLASTK